MFRSLVAAVLVTTCVSGGMAGGQEIPASMLSQGDVVVTGFSGTLAPDPATLRPGSDLLDETLIDVEGISARILSIAAPGFVWDGRAWAGQSQLQFRAGDIGQVFGVALDDAESPNVYLAATSAYGLPIVAADDDGDGRPERLLEGQAGAQFMTGQFGPGPDGGPGSIWKIDGVTGAVSLFANVMLEGVANPGPGLGNITYDAGHSQLFVSDRSTGMIHRFDLAGGELEIYDHGVTGRAAADLPTVAYDPAGTLDITRDDFDTEDPDSWGYAAADRQVWGLAIHDGRLYYSVVDDSQIWSIGIDAATGAFAGDPRWELDVPKRPSKLPVSDIIFTQLGAMIMAQRDEITSTYDYAGFAKPGEARLYRYWLESPDNPETPSRWIAEPEEYAVGFGGDNRQTAGGVDLQYGFNADGLLDMGYCEASLLTTGDDLRLAPDLIDALLPGGPLAIDGLQGMPAGPVKPENMPPWASYMVDLDAVTNDADVQGYVGDVAVYRRACGGDLPYISEYAGAGYPSDPPYISGPKDPEVLPVCTAVDCPLPEFKIVKTCSAATINSDTGKPNVQCQITVSSNGAPFQGNLSVNESVIFGGSMPFNDTITSVISADSWICDQPPFAPTDPTLCKINWAGLTAAGYSSVIEVGLDLPDPGFMVETQNCATLSLDGDELGQSCVKFTGEEFDVSLKKSFEQDPGEVGKGTFTLAITNEGAPFDATGAISVTDDVPAGMTISAATATDWTCLPLPITGPGSLTCNYTGTSMIETGDTTQVVLAATAGSVMVHGPQLNCAGVSLSATSGYVDSNAGNNEDCADVPNDDTVELIDVSLEKSYEPDPVVQGRGNYTLTITNEGAPFDATGAISVTDDVPAGMTIFSASGADWSCVPLPITGPGPLTCDYTGTSVIETGDTTQVVLATSTESVDLLENCASVSINSGSGYEDSNAENDRDCANGDGFIDATTPPDFNPVCGTNVIFVVDESRSVADANATYYINNALANAASIFNANGSQAAVIRFSDSATLAYPMAAATYPLVTNGYNPAIGGGTNWEAAMLAALGLLPSPNTIIVFITDGTPTAYLDAGAWVTYTTDSVLATNEAIGVVNLIYAQGTPIVGIGIGSVSTHLNALLGVNTQSSSFSGLDDALSGLARNACPDLYLRKQIANSYINFHDVTADVHTTVTLTVTNTSAQTLTNVTVEDALPAELTTPTGFSQPATVSGSTVNWTIPSLVAGATTAMNFDVIVAPNPAAPIGQYRCIPNYAQVTASGGTVNSTPNNMASPITGPVVEHDEASSSVCVTDYVYVPTNCGSSYLWVTKKADFAEVCVPGGNPGCTFSITVTAKCEPFSGPVLFGEGVTQGSAPVVGTISNITNTATPAICAWNSAWTAASTPTSCTANITLPVNQSITFAVTLAAPLNVGSGYKNCFVADGKPTLPADYNAAYADLSPTTAPNGGMWGNCAPFSVAAPAQLIQQPDEPTVTTKRNCAAGTQLSNGKCLPKLECNRPAVLNSKGTACICPKGTVAKGDQCVERDVKPLECNRPAVPNSKGTACICPKGTVALGDQCVELDIKPLECNRPAVPNSKGTACICPQGTIAKGDQCVELDIKPLECNRPAVPNSKGTACICPQGTIAKGDQCVELEIPNVIIEQPKLVPEEPKPEPEQPKPERPAEPVLP